MSVKKSWRIVWLKSGPLHPVDTGGKIRTYQMLKELNRRHPVHYVALDPTAREHTAQASEYSRTQTWIDWQETPKGSPKFVAELGANFLFSRNPYVIDKYRSQSWEQIIAKLDGDGAMDVLVCDFLTPAPSVFHGGFRPKTPCLLFQHNVEALIWERMAANAKGLKKWYFNQQWQRLRTVEREFCEKFDAVVGVSDNDCDLMRKDYGLTNVLGSVPTGVDVDFFQPSTQPAKPGKIVFLGSMDWQPNIDCVLYFNEAIWPRIKKADPQATFVIVGRKPPEKVLALAKADPSIIITGTVPDVRPHLNDASVMVVPLRAGGGTRIKIYEALAMALPVVSTRVGAEGLDITDKVDIRLEDEPNAFADAVIGLLKSPEERARIGGNARKLVCEKFSWSSVTDQFESYLEKTVERAGKRG